MQDLLFSPHILLFLAHFVSNFCKNKFENAYFSKHYSILCPIPQVVHIINVSAIFDNFCEEIFAKTRKFSFQK
jgi:hypothetical protein